MYLHATAWWNLASISEPGDLGLGETANSWCWNNCALSLRDWLGAFTLLETSHNYRKTIRTKNGHKKKGNPKSQVQISIPLFHLTFGAPKFLPCALCAEMLHWATYRRTAPCCCHGFGSSSGKARRNHEEMTHRGTLNWLIFIVCVLCVDASRAINLYHTLNVCITQHSRWPPVPLYHDLQIHFICNSSFIPPSLQNILDADKNMALISLLYVLPICKWDMSRNFW